MPLDEPMLTPLQGLVAMRMSLERFYARAGNDMETLIADVTLEPDGRPVDPAAWEDWSACVRAAATAAGSD